LAPKHAIAALKHKHARQKEIMQGTARNAVPNKKGWKAQGYLSAATTFGKPLAACIKEGCCLSFLVS